jgi:hypothetical protein
MKEEGRRKKEEGRRKKEEGRGFDLWIQTPDQNERHLEVGVLNPQLKG